MFTRNGFDKKAKNRNGVPVVSAERTFSDFSKVLGEGFPGFEKLPRVQLTRSDITPQVKKAYYDKITEKCLQKCGPQGSLHAKRLAQKCGVNLRRQDLDKLRHDLVNHRNAQINPGSDSIAEVNKFKISDKSFVNEEKPVQQTTVCTPNPKKQKRVSFSEYVIIHELEEYYKCRKCSKLFEKYELLKKHTKQFHKKCAVKQFTIQKSISSDAIENTKNEKNVSGNAIIRSFTRENIPRDNVGKNGIEGNISRDAIKKILHRENYPADIIEKITIRENLHTGTVEQMTTGSKAHSETIKNINAEQKTATGDAAFCDIREVGNEKVHKKLRKTIVSDHQCQYCSKYYSTRYCLRRHIETQHYKYNNLPTCQICEETFAWPSLLKTHQCIRLNLPEMPFQDSRPEVHFDNLNEIDENGLNDLNISGNENYINVMTFEIPTSIVDSTQREDLIPSNEDRFAQLSNLGYEIIMQQEVPIEF